MEDQILRIGKKAPIFSAEAYHEDQVKNISLEDYKGKWVVLFFYPADFTFVCPTELQELAQNYDILKGMEAEVLSVSPDTVFVHKAWHDNSEAIKQVKFPMLADPTKQLCKMYNTYIPESGKSFRGTFLIDPDGILKAYEMHDDAIGRSSEELIRKLSAAKFAFEHGGEVCPANWKPGKETLRPGLDLVGKI